MNDMHRHNERSLQTGATNFAVIFFRKLLNPSNCIRHLLPPPPLVTLKSHLDFEKQPRIIDRVTAGLLTATYLSFITPF